jgi:uncharacterized protein
MAARLSNGIVPVVRRSLAATLKGLVRGYQLTLSPWLGPRCRFEPSCSNYMLGAIDRYGPMRGGWLGLRRILRCHPWGATGYDPVPEDVHHDSRV